MLRKFSIAAAGPLLAAALLLGGAVPAQADTAMWTEIPLADGGEVYVQTITAMPSQNLTGFQVTVPAGHSVNIVVTDPSDSVVYDQTLVGPLTNFVSNLASPLPVAKNDKFTMSAVAN